MRLLGERRLAKPVNAHHARRRYEDVARRNSPIVIPSEALSRDLLQFLQRDVCAETPGLRVQWVLHVIVRTNTPENVFRNDAMRFDSGCVFQEKRSFRFT